MLPELACVIEKFRELIEICERRRYDRSGGSETKGTERKCYIHGDAQSSLSAIGCERRERPKLSAQLNAKASKLEPSSTRLAAVSVRNPSETKS
jgi:hypothetical protein